MGGRRRKKNNEQRIVNVLEFAGCAQSSSRRRRRRRTFPLRTLEGPFRTAPLLFRADDNNKTRNAELFRDEDGEFGLQASRRFVACLAEPPSTL